MRTLYSKKRNINCSNIIHGRFLIYPSRNSRMVLKLLTDQSMLFLAELTLYLLVSSADNFCKEFGHIAGLTKRWA